LACWRGRVVVGTLYFDPFCDVSQMAIAMCKFLLSFSFSFSFTLLDIQDFIAWGARKTDKTNVGKRELVLERGVEAELGESCWSSCWDVQAS
jgi:hypothetical protein